PTRRAPPTIRPGPRNGRIRLAAARFSPHRFVRATEGFRGSVRNNRTSDSTRASYGAGRRRNARGVESRECREGYCDTKLDVAASWHSEREGADESRAASAGNCRPRDRAPALVARSCTNPFLTTGLVHRHATRA